MRLLFAQIKQLVPLSAPLLVAKISIPIRGFGVTFIFAQLGMQTLAAGALAYSLLMAMVTFFLGVLLPSIGVSVAYATGANDQQETTCILQQGLWLGILLSIPFMLILYHSAPLLLLLGQNKDIVTLAAHLTPSLAWIFIPYSVIITAYKLFTNLGKPHIPMFYSLFGLLFTLITSYALALGQWGLPALGIAGVGWGMAAGYWVQSVIMMFQMSLGRLTHHYAIFTHFSWPKPKYLQKLWNIGWPVGLRYNLEFFLYFIFAAIIGAYDHHDLAVYQIVLQLFMISSCLASGVGVGTEVLVGQAIGRKEKTIIKPACYAGLLLTMGYIGIAVFVIFSFRHQIEHIFFTEGSYDFILLIHILGLVVVFQFLDGLHKVLSDILVVLKKSQFTLLAGAIGMWGVGLPMGCVLGIYSHYGLVGFVLGLVLGIGLSLIITAFAFHHELRRFSN